MRKLIVLILELIIHMEVYHAMAVHSDHETPRCQSDKEVGTPNEPKKIP